MSTTFFASKRVEYQFLRSDGEWKQHCTSWSTPVGASHQHHLQAAYNVSFNSNQATSPNVAKARCIDIDGNVLDQLG